MCEPVHALDWIREHGTKRRSITANELYKKLNRQARECTWCGTEVEGRRRSWCSDECVEQYQLYCVPAEAAGFVYRRDRGTCQHCRRNIEVLNALHSALWGVPYQVKHEFDKAKVASGYWKRADKRPWEIDHVVPVSEGGGLCGPTGLRLVCIPCHKQLTAELRSKKAKNSKEKE